MGVCIRYSSDRGLSPDSSSFLGAGLGDHIGRNPIQSLCRAMVRQDLQVEER